MLSCAHMKKFDKNKVKTLEDFKREVFKRPGVRKAYAEMQPEFQIIRKLAIERANKKLNQRQLAKKIGVTQSALARFESGKINPTLSFIQKIVSGLGMQLIVK
jgi:HTH-type transcriptional regulator / antitoxin HipB